MSGNSALGQGFQCCQITSDQWQFLVVRPTFELAFGCNRLLFRVMSLLIHQLDGPTARGPRRTTPVVVCFHPFLDIQCVPYVQGPVAATDDVDEERTCWCGPHSTRRLLYRPNLPPDHAPFHFILPFPSTPNP